MARGRSLWTTPRVASGIISDRPRAPPTLALRASDDDSKLRHGPNKPLYIFRPRQAVIAVLDQRQHHVIAGKARDQRLGMLPRHIRILHALEDAHRAAGLDHPAQQQMIAAFLD